MKLKKILLVLIASTCVLVVPSVAKEKETVKIVYQCDFPDVKRVHLMLNTLNNAVKHYQSTLEDYEINIVALGPCLQYVMKDFKGTGYVKKPYITKGGPAGNGTIGRIKSLLMTAGDNMKFWACENTMKKQNVKAEQIEDFVALTPGGIIKIVDLQREGAAYIKIM